VSEPAQKTLVERFISWPLIEQRLKRYPAIARAFPLALLQKHRNTPPYFCHYMAWRLGVWSEAPFPRLEELLLFAESLPKWDAERPLRESPDFSDFWSLVWLMQVAEYLSTVGVNVQWRGAGPDLSVDIHGTTIFVECVTYRKSFGLRSFLEEVLTPLGNDIRLGHNFFEPLSLPTDGARSDFLDKALTPFLDPAQLETLRTQARSRYPVRIIAPGSSLEIYLDGQDVSAYDPALDNLFTGDPEAYIAVILKEAVGNKRESNQLAKHRPNLLAVSYLLSAEAQVAFELREIKGSLDLGSSIDGVALSTVGIDEKLSRPRFILVANRSPLDPALRALAQPL
jgi:hypothetical protein